MDLKQFCKMNSQLSIYGCGMYGKFIKEILEEKQIKVSSFIISDGENIAQWNEMELPVLKLSEWERLYSNKEHGILIGVSDIHQANIVNNLKQRQIKNYFVPQLKDYDINKIGVMDTTVNSVNKGNDIIMQAVYRNLFKIYKDSYFYKLPFFDDFDKFAMQNAEQCKYIFVGGTNALNSQMDISRDIGINLDNIDKFENKVVLMGVGWREYEDKPNLYTANILHRILNKDIIHSVRDSYTEEMLRSIGIENVLNTGCPTIWRLNKEHCRQISKKKGKDVIVMVSSHDLNRDTFIMNVIKKNYDKIYFWPQSTSDYVYMKRMCPKAICISPQLEELEAFLDVHDNLDYIGTRLHGGIKCLQYKKRSIIIAIDNRAIEMKKDFCLPVVLSEEVGNIERIINRENITDIHIPEDKINLWINQFSD